MKIEIKLDRAAIAKLEKAARESALAAAEQVRADLEPAEVMPFDTGDMQNNQTFVAKTDEGAAVVTGSPQARRLYYHPEYKFKKTNRYAGANWFEPYISGDKKELAPNAFKTEFKKRSGV